MKNKNITYKIDNVVHKVIIKKEIEKYLLKDLVSLESDKKVLFIYDENIDSKFIKKIVDLIKLSGGDIEVKKIQGTKKNKNLKNLLSLFKILLKKRFTKQSVVISCGGGVVGDLCGLLSSLYLRGTYYFHIPSTMTAIVDSCVGGKTAINHQGIINSMGNYHHPNRVYIAYDMIKKIPDREYYSGFSEILKCGLLGNKKILNILISKKDYLVSRNFNYLSILIEATLKKKISLFINDIKEKNKRLHLNLGHTFAHAIEMATDRLIKKDFFRHGEAVGIGILCEVLLSNSGKNEKNLKLINKIKLILTKYNLPIKIKLPKNISIIKMQNEIYKNVFLDKKRLNKNPRYIFLKKIGKPVTKEIDNYNLLNEVIFKFIN